MDEHDKWVAFFKARPIPQKLLNALANAPLVSLDDPVLKEGGQTIAALAARRTEKRLTFKEKQVLVCASLGYGIQGTVKFLGRGEETIKTQRRRVILVLEAKDMHHAIGIGLREGIIQ